MIKKIKKLKITVYKQLDLWYDIYKEQIKTYGGKEG